MEKWFPTYSLIFPVKHRGKPSDDGTTHREKWIHAFTEIEKWEQSFVKIELSSLILFRDKRENE